ncbi:MAG: CotH kinase family protein [Myxococcota bacterium]
MSESLVSRVAPWAVLALGLSGVACQGDGNADGTGSAGSTSTGGTEDGNDTGTPADDTEGQVDETGIGGSTGDAATGDTGGPEPIDWDAAFDHVFPQDHVVEVTIDPEPGTWEALLDEWDQTSTKTYYPSAMTFDGEPIATVGFRLKGWSSLRFGSAPGGVPLGPVSSPDGKFPLKVDFDRYGGPRYHDVNKVNFGNNWADLSYMRERLANRLYNAMGVPAARTAYARVSVDGHDNGTYVTVQQIDKCFLEERFGIGNGNGNLYKGVFTDTDIGALVYRGPNREDYLSTTTCPGGFDECGLVLKTNEDDPEKNDYSDLIHFLDVLNNTPDAQFDAAIDEVFDVDSFLRLSAVTVVTSSFDGYLGMGHNYYLYHRPDTDQFMMLPWDQNEAYAGHPCGQNALTFPIDQVVCNQRGHDFVLSRRIFDVPAHREQYRAYVQELVDDYFTEEQHNAWIAEFISLVQSEIETDPNYIQDLTIFERSLGYSPPGPQNLGGHGGIEYSLMHFVRERRTSVLVQLGS